MTRSLLCTVAAFGLLTSGALAQNAEKPAAGGMQAPAASAPAGEGGEQRLPPGGAAPKAAPGGAEKVPGAKGGMASPGMKPAPDAEPTPGQRQKGENAGVEPKKPGQAGEQQPAKPGKTGEAQPGQKAGEAKPGAEGNKAGGPAKPAPKLTTKQSTEVKTAFRSVHVQPVHVDFNVSIGVAVPRTVVLEPVPPEIVTIVPAYEGFRFFVVPGEIVIVDPVTLEVVYVLPI